MKKLLFVLGFSIAVCSISACGDTNYQSATTATGASDATDSSSTISATNVPTIMPSMEEPETAEETLPAISGTTIDLTVLSSTMVYSEVYNMMMVPEEYMGKKVKMSGSFVVYEDETTGKRYFSCMISDATACCSQGLEFVLQGDYSYPDDYPELYSEITVTGIFNTYEEEGINYCQLIDAEIVP